MTIAIALGLVVETGLFLLAAFVGLRRAGLTLAEAGCGAVVVLFMGLSLLHQVCGWLGHPGFALAVEAAAIIVLIILGQRRLGLMTGELGALQSLARAEPLALMLLGSAWALLALAIGLSWSAGVGPAAPVLWAPSGLDPIPVLNTRALFFHTLRFGLLPGACGFGLLAHMAMALGTYALARRYAWPAMALTLALLVVGMPRLVALALAPRAELVSSLALLFALVLLVRLLEQHRPLDLWGFVLSLLFSLETSLASRLRLPILAILLVVVMVRRHGWAPLRATVTARPLLTTAFLLPVLVLAQVPTMLFNLNHGMPLLGALPAAASPGPAGAAANMLGYLFAAVDLTQPVNALLFGITGLDLQTALQSLCRTLVGWLGAGDTIVAPLFSGGGRMGFGPGACLLILPAMVHAALRGSRRLKALCVAWAGVLYLTALVIPWPPDPLAMLTPILAANGFVVAFFLPAWRLRRRGMRLLQIGATLLLVLAIAQGVWR